MKISALAVLFALTGLLGAAQAAPPEEVIARIKGSIVAVGTYVPTRSPQFNFRGTGFVVGDGTLIATNAHVVPAVLDERQMESIAIALPGGGTQGLARTAVRVAYDPEHDLALLRIKGPPLPALSIKDSESVREGQTVYFTGYPIGAVLGLYPATHRAMVSALTPIVIPGANAAQLNPKTIRQLGAKPLTVFQLDGTAYPGNSGSPVYDPESGAILGVINMVFVKGTKESALSQPSGISYAIPAKYVEALLRELPSAP